MLMHLRSLRAASTVSEQYLQRIDRSVSAERSRGVGPDPGERSLRMTVEIENFIRNAARARGIDSTVAIRVAKSEVRRRRVREARDVLDGLVLVGRSSSITAGPGTSIWAMSRAWGTGSRSSRSGSRGQILLERCDQIRLEPREGVGLGAPGTAPRMSGSGSGKGIDRSHPWDANAETWDYELTAPTALTYTPNQPPERQVQD